MTNVVSALNQPKVELFEDLEPGDVFKMATGSCEKCFYMKLRAHNGDNVVDLETGDLGHLGAGAGIVRLPDIQIHKAKRGP